MTGQRFVSARRWNFCGGCNVYMTGDSDCLAGAHSDRSFPDVIARSASDEAICRAGGPERARRLLRYARNDTVGRSLCFGPEGFAWG